MTKSNKISSPRNIYPKVYLFREKYGIYTYESESIQWFEFVFVIKKLVFWTHSQIDCALNICKLAPLNVLKRERVGTLIYFILFFCISGLCRVWKEKQLRRIIPWLFAMFRFDTLYFQWQQKGEVTWKCMNCTRKNPKNSVKKKNASWRNSIGDILGWNIKICSKEDVAILIQINLESDSFP